MAVVSVPVRSPRTLGAVIGACRRRDGWTQEEIAESLVVSRAWMIRLERGVMPEFVGRLFRTLRRLKITVTLTYEDGLDWSEDERSKSARNSE